MKNCVQISQLLGAIDGDVNGLMENTKIYLTVCNIYNIHIDIIICYKVSI